MIKLTLKGNVQKEIAAPMTAADIAQDISMGLFQAACAASVDGQTVDLRYVVDRDCDFSVLTFDDEEGRKAYWHTASHVLAQAVKRLYGDVKLGVGPAISDGFFYDFDAPQAFTPEDLEKIEGEMKAIIKEAIPLTREEVTPEEALALMRQRNEPYKMELIEEHAAKGDRITLYHQGDFVDLCAGPHLLDTGKLKAVKLTQCTGAYWRSDAKNAQMSRVYGTAFPKQKLLDEHLAAVAEAKKRDHNKIGRELEYFTTVDYIGQGLAIMMPKGAKVIQLLQRFVEDTEEARGYQLTKTPFMAKSDLYKISGHWDHYRDGMFVLGDEEKDDEVFALRPMTCPFQFQVYLNRLRSYRELPMRLNETSTLFRNESSGEMHGLIRLRQFTISEGHIACLPEQLEDEFKGCLELARYMLDTLGLEEDVSYRFSKWDENDREKYIGTPEEWEVVQNRMRQILDHLEIPYTEASGEAAFYGPKLDIQIKNVHGKEDTLITIQIDFQLAEKFGMEYVDADGSRKFPYVIHRTSIGCYERTLALLLEKYAGALPLWLSPEQVRLLPISDRQAEYAAEVCQSLKDAGLRVTVDGRNEKIGYKIREAQLEKIPYMLVIGDKEMESGTVSVRSRKEGDGGVMTVAEFKARAVQETVEKVK